jgi:hypothetical protein
MFFKIKEKYNPKIVYEKNHYLIKFKNGKYLGTSDKFLTWWLDGFDSYDVFKYCKIDTLQEAEKVLKRYLEIGRAHV